MTVRRDGEWWFFEIPAINLSGQASRLSEVESEARDIIATWLQVDPTTITVTLDVVVPDAMDQPKLPEQTELPRDIAGYQAVKSADDGGRVSELETLENAGDAQEAAEILARIESGQERTYTTAGSPRSWALRWPERRSSHACKRFWGAMWWQSSPVRLLGRCLGGSQARPHLLYMCSEYCVTPFGSSSSWRRLTRMRSCVHGSLG